MEVHCQQCGEVQEVGDKTFGNHEKVDLACSKCGKTFQVINPKLATFRPEATRKKVPIITSEISIDGLVLSLLDNQEIVLRAIEGQEKGTVYPVDKPRITIGRANSDVIVDDMLSSRVHCSLEVMDQTVLLRDLSSTNGTYVNDQPIRAVTLSNGSIFRIGGHSFQLVITPKER